MKRVEVQYQAGADAEAFEGDMTQTNWEDFLRDLRSGDPEDLIRLPFAAPASAWIIRKHIIAVGVVDNG